MTNTMGRSDKTPELLTAGRSATPEAHGERRLVSPFRCRVWAQHSRPEEQLTEGACKSLRESIEKNGQHQPALGRPVTDDPDYDVELICGARRHAAALALGRQLIVELRVMTDAEAYVAMYEENVERKDDCPYVQGQILRRALLSGACSSQEHLCHAFGLSHSKVSRLLMIAQLPSVVVAAFPCPDDIRESWGVALYQLWKAKDPEYGVAVRARTLAKKQPRPPARQVYEALVTPSGGTPRAKRPNRSLPVFGTHGLILFREEDRIETVTFTVPKALLGSTRRDTLRQAMMHVLDP